jgi:hypothetical protein
MAYEHFWVVFLATIPVAIVQPFLVNSASRLATVWFGEEEVTNLYFH